MDLDRPGWYGGASPTIHPGGGKGQPCRPPVVSPALRARILGYQRNEITEHHIYRRIAAVVKDPANRAVLERISDEELGHYRRWRQYSGADVGPSRWRVFLYAWLARILGFTFAIKLMEHGEEGAREEYGDVSHEVEEAKAIANDEEAHEEALVAMLDEERLRYIGSIVLGLSDALVELTGALAGLTLALRNTRLIALTGLITGIAAALSMAASEYLSTKTEAGGQHPVKAAGVHGLHLPLHRGGADRAVPALPELPPGPRPGAGGGAADHPGLQRLCGGGPGRALRAPVPGNGGAHGRGLRLHLRAGLPDPARVGNRKSSPTEEKTRCPPPRDSIPPCSLAPVRNTAG